MAEPIPGDLRNHPVVPGFHAVHRRDPEVVGTAPGRVNLIGEHTDYNGGRCLPMAIGLSTHAAASARSDDELRLTSSQGVAWTGRHQDVLRGDVTGWAAYPAGVVRALGVVGWDLPGLDLHVHGYVPLGAGLASSAALTVSVAMAIAALTGHADDPDLVEVLLAATVRAETEFVGAPTGGLDQAAALRARDGHALLLDFDTGEDRLVPWSSEAAGVDLLVVDTGVAHAHVAGGFARRRAECEQAAALLGVESLSRATHQDLTRLPEPLRSRVRHVLTENRRVTAVVAAAAESDWSAVGRLWSQSHASLRDDHQVSCAELDLAVQTAMAHGALGARMTGGGFGGSAIVLSPGPCSAQIESALEREFRRAGYGVPSVHRVHPADGARSHRL